MKITFLFIIFVSILSISCNKESDDIETPLSELVITAIPAFDIKGDIVISGGSVMSSGNSSISRRGVCYSLSSNPTINDTIIEADNTLTEFTLNLPGLEFNSTYFLKAFAENADGIKYSDEVSFTTTNTCTLNVYEGSVILFTQQEVEAFASNNYCAITGHIIIGPSNSSQIGDDPIVDISGLSNLRLVKDLEIRNTYLTTLEGVNNISVINRNLLIAANEQISDIDPLINVNSPLHKIDIGGNFILNNLNGLSNIPSLISHNGIGPVLNINSNLQIETLAPLAGIIIDLDSNMRLTLSNMPSLTSLEGLPLISGRVSVLEVSFAPQITNLDVFSLITEVDLFNLRNNQSLNDFSGLESISKISFWFVVSNMNQINTLNWLSSLETVTESTLISIMGNDNLTDFCNLSEALEPGASYNYVVDGNGYNPTLQDLMDGNCLL